MNESPQISWKMSEHANMKAFSKNDVFDISNKSVLQDETYGISKQHALINVVGDVALGC